MDADAAQTFGKHRCGDLSGDGTIYRVICRLHNPVTNAVAQSQSDVPENGQTAGDVEQIDVRENHAAPQEDAKNNKGGDLPAVLDPLDMPYMGTIGEDVAVHLVVRTQVSVLPARAIPIKPRSERVLLFTIWALAEYVLPLLGS